MSTSRQFNAALDELNYRHDVDHQTLNMVASVINAHAGQRVTVAPGQGKRHRQNQAQALATGGRTDPKTIAQRLGVSESSARRYLSKFKK